MKHQMFFWLGHKKQSCCELGHINSSFVYDVKEIDMI